MPQTRAAPATAYRTAERRYAGHTHCARCGAPEPPRRVADVTGPRPRHQCAFGDMVECPGCQAPIVRRLPDGAPLNMDLSPHRCPQPDPAAGEAGYQADLEAGVALGYWPWYPAQRRRREEAEARDRDREADEYAAWVRYRTLMGLPDAGEGELP